MIYKKIKLINLLLLFSILSSFLAAQNQDANTDSVKIAIFKNAQPVVFVDEHNKAKGIYPEILYQILSDAGYSIEFLIFDTFDEAYKASASGKADIMPALIKTVEREKLFNYGEVSFFVSWSQVYVNNNTDIESVFDLHRKKVGMQKGGQNGKNFDALMKSFDIPYKKIELDNFDEITSQLAEGRIDAGIYFSTFFNKELRVKPTNIIFSPSNSFIAVPKTRNTELLRVVDEGLRAAKDDPESFYHGIMKKYRFVYSEEFIPTWVIIASTSLAVLLLLSIIFVFLLRLLVKKVTMNLVIEKERAEESDKLKTGFLTRISHELRTPLNGIMGMLELMSYTELNDEQLKFLIHARTATNNLYKIIEGLLDFNESSNQIIPPDFTETDIGKTIGTILPSLCHAAEKKGLKIELRIHDEPLQWVTNPESLLQIMVQLILNAIQYSEKGIITIEVLGGENLEIYIRDQGIGIEESYHTEIFIPFHQLENPFTRIHGGLGIGLAIVNRICSRIDGEIILSSIPEKGSEFKIKLPKKNPSIVTPSD